MISFKMFVLIQIRSAISFLFLQPLKNFFLCKLYYDVFVDFYQHGKLTTELLMFLKNNPVIVKKTQDLLQKCFFSKELRKIACVVKSDALQAKSDPDIVYEFALQKFDIYLNYLMEFLLKFNDTKIYSLPYCRCEMRTPV